MPSPELVLLREGCEVLHRFEPLLVLRPVRLGEATDDALGALVVPHPERTHEARQRRGDVLSHPSSRGGSLERLDPSPVE